jgi:general secretion pathway protein G
MEARSPVSSVQFPVASSCGAVKSSWRLATGNWKLGTTLNKRRERGFTFIELLVVTTILLILASAVMPLARVTVQRQKEAELRRYLREMRTAIDKFKDAADAGVIGAFDIKAGSEGYPPDLETLVEGVSVVNDQSGRKLKFLRRVPIDPMTSSSEWGKRSYQDRPDASSWGGQNVFDVYTKSTGTALDGTKYRDW